MLNSIVKTTCFMSMGWVMVGSIPRFFKIITPKILIKELFIADVMMVLIFVSTLIFLLLHERKINAKH